MGRIFIAITHRQEPTVRLLTSSNTWAEITYAQQMILLRDQIVSELRSRGCEVLCLPDHLNSNSSIEWINKRVLWGDVALAIQADMSNSPKFRGTTVFYITHNIERKKHAELILLLLLRRLPQITTRSTKPDTASSLGKLNFCRQVIIPSLIMTVGCLTNSDDLSLLTNQRHKIALGIADGLTAWSREVAGNEPNQSALSIVAMPNYPVIKIKVNQRDYLELGILIYGNPYIPINLVDRFGINFNLSHQQSLVEYQGIVYFRAIELRDFNISVNWDNINKTVLLRSILPISNHPLAQIMGQGYTSDLQMMLFLKNHNEEAVKDFPNLAKIYQEEAILEGVNHDLAFCQMCLETNFLHSHPAINNFANLGSSDGSMSKAVFANPRLGVRAQIQHLKAYASLEPLVQEVIDPRFHLITRGVAPTITNLSGRWAADLLYGEKIMALLRQLYESANLL